MKTATLMYKNLCTIAISTTITIFALLYNALLPQLLFIVAFCLAWFSLYFHLKYYENTKFNTFECYLDLLSYVTFAQIAIIFFSLDIFSLQYLLYGVVYIITIVIYYKLIKSNKDNRHDNNSIVNKKIKSLLVYDFLIILVCLALISFSVNIFQNSFFSFPKVVLCTLHIFVLVLTVIRFKKYGLFEKENF